MTVFKGYLKITRRNIGLILMYLVIFFGITMIFQATTKGAEYENFKAASVKIAVIDEDRGTLAEGLIDYLKQFHHVELLENDSNMLQEKLFYRNIEYIVRIPENFYQSCIRDGKELKVTKVPGSYTSFYVDQQMNSYLNTVRVYDAAGFTEKEAAEAAAVTKNSDVQLLNTSGNAGVMPGYAFYFRYLPYLFLVVLCYTMGNIICAFRRGDLPKRMAASAVSGRRQNLEALLAMTVLGAGLWGIALTGAVVMYGKAFLTSDGMPYYLLNSVLMLFIALALAYLVGMFTKNSNMLNGLTNVLSLGMCFLSGVFVPMEIMNKHVLRVAQFLPVYWYETVNERLIEFGSVTGAVREEIWKAFALETVFAVVLICMILAVSKRQSAD